MTDDQICISYIGVSTIVSPKSACVNGSQEDFKRLHEFLSSHVGEKIRVTYGVIKND